MMIRKLGFRYGIYPSFFDDLTITECLEYIEVLQEKEKNELKEKVSLNYSLAQQIAMFVGCSMSKESKPTPLFDFFPGLFEDELEEVNESRQIASMENRKSMLMRKVEIDKKKGVR